MEPTGIKVLDELLGGGFPRPSAVGITGPVGSGKSTLVKQTMGIMDSLTPFFLMVEAKKVFQYGQVLKYATRFAKSIGIATLHTSVLNETIENAMTNFADIVIDMEGRKNPQGISHGGTLRLVKMGTAPTPPRRYYYER